MYVWIGGPVGWMGRSFVRAAIWTTIQVDNPEPLDEWQLAEREDSQKKLAERE